MTKKDKTQQHLNSVIDEFESTLTKCFNAIKDEEIGNALIMGDGVKLGLKELDIFPYCSASCDAIIGSEAYMAYQKRFEDMGIKTSISGIPALGNHEVKYERIAKSKASIA